MRPTSFPALLVSRTLIDIFIRFGLIALLAVFCFQIFKPFLNFVVWSIILAITLYPLQVRLRGKIFVGEGRTAALISFLMIAVLLVPAYLLGAALVDSAEHALAVVVNSGGVRLPPPAASVADWPIVGPRFYDVWLLTATDATSAVQRLAPQIKAGSVTMLGAVGGLGVGLLVFLGALIVSGTFMAYGELGTRSAVQIASRLSGPDRGPRIAALCTATIRAVAQGVIGIAFIQMLLIGIAIPGAGLLAPAEPDAVAGADAASIADTAGR